MCGISQNLGWISIVDKKFRFKGVGIDLDNLVGRKEDFRNAWESSLRHQLKDLPNFDVVFDDVLKFLGGVLMKMEKLKKLIEHRDAILLAEIGALIHDLGKLSEEFVKQMSKDVIFRFDHEDIIKDKYKQDFWLNSMLYDLLKGNNTVFVKIMRDLYQYLKDRVSNFPKDKQNMNYFGELISKHGSPGSLLYPWFFKFSADITDSGIDKGAVIHINKQFGSHSYISTPFGYEFEKINVNSQQLKQLRKKFIKKLEVILEKNTEIGI